MDINLLNTLEWIARTELFRWDSIHKHNSLKESLQYSIGLGGGCTINSNIGPYWGYWAYPSFRVDVWSKDPKNPKVTISPSEFILIAKCIWDKEKIGQTSLFES